MPSIHESAPGSRPGFMSGLAACISQNPRSAFYMMGSSDNGTRQDQRPRGWTGVVVRMRSVAKTASRDADLRTRSMHPAISAGFDTVVQMESA